MKQEQAILDRLVTVRIALGLSFPRLLLPIYMLQPVPRPLVNSLL